MSELKVFGVALPVTCLHQLVHAGARNDGGRALETSGDDKALVELERRRLNHA